MKGSALLAIAALLLAPAASDSQEYVVVECQGIKFPAYLLCEAGDAAHLLAQAERDALRKNGTTMQKMYDRGWRLVTAFALGETGLSNYVFERKKEAK